VLDAAVSVTVDVPAFNEDPTPDVSQLPLTVHVPLVNVMVPEVPPIIVTVETLVVEAFATRRPALSIVSAPPVRPRLLVARVVVPLPPRTVRVPDQRRPFAAIVKDTVDAPALNVTFPPNSGVWLAKVIVCEVDALNVIEARKLHDADVEAFVQDPEAVHTPGPVDVMYPAGLLTLTFPMTETVEAFVRRMPVAPLTVSPPPIDRE
jgi:hypothetical protein